MKKYEKDLDVICLMGGDGKNKLYRMVIQTPWSISIVEGDVDTLVGGSFDNKELVLSDAFEYGWNTSDDEKSVCKVYAKKYQRS